MGVLFGEDADDASDDFVVDYSLVVFAYGVDSLVGRLVKVKRAEKWDVRRYHSILVRIVHS